MLSPITIMLTVAPLTMSTGGLVATASSKALFPT